MGSSSGSRAWYPAGCAGGFAYEESDLCNSEERDFIILRGATSTSSDASLICGLDRRLERRLFEEARFDRPLWRFWRVEGEASPSGTG